MIVKNSSAIALVFVCTVREAAEAVLSGVACGLGAGTSSVIGGTGRGVGRGCAGSARAAELVAIIDTRARPAVAFANLFIGFRPDMMFISER